MNAAAPRVQFAITRWAFAGGDKPVSVMVAESPSASPATTGSVLRFAPAERRRLNPLTVAALQCAEAVVDPAWVDRLDEVPIVFASAEGDGDVLARILEAIGRCDPVSPTQFHNSVHNAAAGYWTIGLRSQSSGTALAAGDETMAVALGEAGMQACAFDKPVIVVFAERAFPPALAHGRPDLHSCSVGAWCEPAGAAVGWTCELVPGLSPTAASAAELARALVSGRVDEATGSFAVARLGATLQIARSSAR